jgi:hypothetical protein
MRYMATIGWSGLAAMALVLAGCGTPSTPEDRAALVGLWAPTDASGMTVEFHENGVFDYLYSAIFRANWELGNKGEIKFSGEGGSYPWTCYYKIEQATLTIDNGQGQTCFTPQATPPDPMPLTYTKVQ